MFCPSCGKQIPDDSLFCLKCGRSMSVAPNAQPVETPTPAHATTTLSVQTTEMQTEHSRWSSRWLFILLAAALLVTCAVLLPVVRTTHSGNSAGTAMNAAPMTGAAGTGAAGTTAATRTAPPSAPPPPVKLSPGEIEAKYCNAVVTLESYNDQGQKFSQGSGFIVSVQGKILTNYHVIRGASRMQARLRDQSTRDVESIAGYDIEHDLAALKISGDEFPAVHLGSSAAVKTGDHVTALGAPLGLQNTLSDGIISAIREIGPSRMFQTSTPISHGSSGGPLFDDFGNVIGLIVATVEAGENLNFAVPIDSANRLLASDRNTKFGELLEATTVRQQILNSSLSLPAQVVPVDVVVPKQGATLSGSFSIAGGMRNDLGLRLIGPAGNIVWNAGVLQNAASLNLRLAPGRYRLVFDNKVTSWWVSPKTISGTVELSYYR